MAKATPETTRAHYVQGVTLRYPLIHDALEHPPVPCELKVGDVVTFTNDYGVAFPGHVVTGFSPTVYHGRFVYFDHDAWWFSVSPESLSKESTPNLEQ